MSEKHSVFFSCPLLRQSTYTFFSSFDVIRNLYSYLIVADCTKSNIYRQSRAANTHVIYFYIRKLIFYFYISDKMKPKKNHLSIYSKKEKHPC
jgi:hypothetical protein